MLSTLRSDKATCVLECAGPWRNRGSGVTGIDVIQAFDKRDSRMTHWQEEDAQNIAEVRNGKRRGVDEKEYSALQAGQGDVAEGRVMYLFLSHDTPNSSNGKLLNPLPLYWVWQFYMWVIISISDSCFMLLFSVFLFVSGPLFLFPKTPLVIGVGISSNISYCYLIERSIMKAWDLLVECCARFEDFNRFSPMK